MQLFSSTQDSILMSRLEQDTVLPSQRLCFMVEYLRMFTTHTKIPRAEILAGLWELLWKPLVSECLLSLCVCVCVVCVCVCVVCVCVGVCVHMCA